MFVHIAQEKTVNVLKVVKDFKDLKDFIRFAAKIALCNTMIICLLQIKR